MASLCVVYIYTTQSPSPPVPNQIWGGYPSPLSDPAQSWGVLGGLGPKTRKSPFFPEKSPFLPRKSVRRLSRYGGPRSLVGSGTPIPTPRWRPNRNALPPGPRCASGPRGALASRVSSPYKHPGGPGAPLVRPPPRAAGYGSTSSPTGCIIAAPQ